MSRPRLEGHPDQPEWLSHVNAGVPKIKPGMATIGISSIHWLRTFIEAGNIGGPEPTNCALTGVLPQTGIQSVFILSAPGTAWMERLTMHDTHSEP